MTRILGKQGWSIRWLTGLIVAGLISVTPAQAAKPKFTYKSLGTLGGATSTAEGLNESGDVVGVSQLPNGSYSPYVYTAAEGMKDLNALTIGLLDGCGYVQFGPDRNSDGSPDLYVTGSLDGATAVAVFDGATGHSMGYLIAPGAGNIRSAAYTLFAPDGHVYIGTSSSSIQPRRDTVLRYRFDTGEFVGVFVTPESGGLLGASGMAFGKDVNSDGTPDLFVAATQSNNVLVYSGTDGSFLVEFVPPGSGGMDGPGDLQFQDIDADGVPELLVTSRRTASILAYNGETGAFLQMLLTSPATGVMLNQFAIGPDGDYYASENQKLESGEFLNIPRVLRFDGETGQFVSVFVPQIAGIRGNSFVTFDNAGDLYVSSSNTNEVVKFRGPLRPDAGTRIGAFVTGVGFNFASANDVNNLGQIVGLGTIPNSSNRVGAYLYNPPPPGKEHGSAIDLELPGDDEEATALNDSGDVAGFFLSPTDNRYHVFLWRPETRTAVDLGMLAGQDTYATSITPRGAGGHVQISGYAKTSSGERGWRFNTATGVMQNLGLISGGSGSSKAWDITTGGLVTGSASAGTKQKAYLRTLTGNMTDLGTLGGNQSYAYGLNAAQSVVGMSDTSSSVLANKHQSFLRTTADGMFKLEPQITNLPSAMQLKVRPTRISNSNRIIGPGSMDPGGVAFILTPQ